MSEPLKEIIYVQHRTGDFEDGLQVCIHCAKVICDYTGHWASSDGSAIRGWPENQDIWITGTQPVITTTMKPPEVNYGGDDPYTRKIVLCTDKI